MSVTAVSLALLLQAIAPARDDAAPVALPNDNRTLAGLRVGDTVALRLVRRRRAGKRRCSASLAWQRLVAHRR